MCRVVIRILTTIPFTLLFIGCATIDGDPNILVTISFSDGSSGRCSLNYKNGNWSTAIPETIVLFRPIDEDLSYSCRTEDGRRVWGWLKTGLDPDMIPASVMFWRIGITDTTIDKRGTAEIPIRKATANATGETIKVTDERQGLLASEDLE